MSGDGGSARPAGAPAADGASDAGRQRAWEALDLGPWWPARSAPRHAAEQAMPAQRGAPDGVAPARGAAERVAPDAVAADAVAADPVFAPDAAAAGRAPRDRVPVALTPPDHATPPDAIRPATDAPDWDGLRAQVASCTACGLCASRTQTVFGSGPVTARWMVIGEAPGAEEDRRGEPFVGASGKLLTRMLASIGLSRADDVFITNVLKCRPPGNRDPQPAEIDACSAYLRRQMEWIAPDMLLLVGRFAAQAVLGTDRRIGALRGRVHEVQIGGRTVPAVCTYHPAYLLHAPEQKRESWKDLVLARRHARGPRDAESTGQVPPA